MPLTIEIPDEVELGSVTVGEKIGGGGFGQVYKAHVYPLDGPFAIKFLDPSPFHAAEAKVRERFIKEANILLSLRHQYITPIYGVGEYDGKPYILMEYFDGMDLYKARDAAGVVKPESVLPFLEMVTSALDYAHRADILHRDIKPSNLMTIRGDARVVDFGVAQALDPEGERLTRDGATPVGRDAFAAPELTTDPRMLDPRCDIFSLGACWFWLLTGCAPKGRDWEFALRKVEGMTQDYETVILKTLGQPEMRYQSMAELLSDLRRLGSGESPEAIDGNIDDDTATVLGVIFEHFVPESEGITPYELEQRVSNVMNKFTLSMALRVLMRHGFIKPEDRYHEFNNYEYKVYTVEDSGQAWVEKNRSRIVNLLPEARVRPAPPDDFDDDIPF